MANGNGMTITTAKIILAIAQAVTIFLLIAVGTQVLALRESQAVMEERVMHMTVQLQIVGNKLDQHIAFDERGESQ